MAQKDLKYLHEVGSPFIQPAWLALFAHVPGGNADSDPFEIDIAYRLVGGRLSFDVATTPWADVSGAGGMNIGRTPLSEIEAAVTTVLEFRRGRTGPSVRVALRTSPSAP